MSLLKRIRLLLLIVGTAAVPAARASCPVEFETNFARLVEAEAALGRAEAALQAQTGVSASRTGIQSALSTEKASIDALLENLVTKGKVNTGQLADIEARIVGLQEAAQGRPVRYTIGDHTGNPRKTPLPSDHETVFAAAVPEPGRVGSVYWGYNGKDFYRYQGSVVGDFTDVHFNGSTSAAEARAIAVGDVPKEVRRYFGVK